MHMFLTTSSVRKAQILNGGSLKVVEGTRIPAGIGKGAGLGPNGRDRDGIGQAKSRLRATLE